MSNIVIGMETLQNILSGCIEAEMTPNGLLEDVATFKRIYLEEEHIDEPFIWMYQHETRPNRQADISRTMELTTPFQFNCAVYEPELEDANESTMNLATRVILSVQRNWQTIQNQELPGQRLIRNITLETFYPLGTVDVNNKSERLPVIAVVLNVNHIIDWRLCCKQNLGE
jgi:hypothetical protein